MLEASSQETTKKMKKKPGGWKAMPYILGNETFERLAAFGLFANFLVYLTRELHIDQVSAANIMSIWYGVTNFGPLLGAFISDAYLGRFTTIAIASFPTLLGMTMVTLTAWIPQLHPTTCSPEQLALNHCEKASKTHLGALFAGLFLLSIGSSGIRPCSIPFGVDQFDPTTHDGRRSINSFFNWYYATFSLVLLFAQTVIVYIQDSISWKVGFGIPTLCMALSIVMFFVGTRIYVHVKPQGSVFSGIAQVFVAAYHKRRLELPCDDDDQEQQMKVTFYDPPPHQFDDSTSGAAPLCTRLPLTNQFRALNKACVILEGEGELNPDRSRAKPWRLVSVQQVEEVKCLARIFPIWTASILTITAMIQQSIFTVSQALKMDQHLGPHFEIPAGSIQVFSFLTITLWVPLYDRLLIPTLRSLTRRDSPISLLHRIGAGIAFSVLSMVVAALVERYRRTTANNHPNALGVAPISVLWLVPQLVLMGLCEAFNIIGQIEFYNRQFPEHMRSIANALLSSSFGVASYVNSLMVTTVHYTTRERVGHVDWLANNLNEGRLDYFYLLLAAIGVVNFGYFVYVAGKYKYRESFEVKDDGHDVHGGDVELSS